MKNSLLICLSWFLVSVTNSSYSQNTANWTGTIDSKSFIENKGQFNGDNKTKAEILFAVDQNPMHIFFTKEGLSYRFDKFEKNKGRVKGDITKPKRLVKTEMVHMTWVGSNPDVNIIAEDITTDYHVYGMLSKDRQKYYDIENVHGYKKIIYKNLYPNIDVEYVFHPETGLKYSFILHPGANASKIKMQYADGHVVTVNANGKILIPTGHGNIVEHAPLTFPAKNEHAIISSKFIVSNNIISFELGEYDHSQKTILDPWVITPTLTNSNGVWECERDGSGNAYIIGGDMPMKLLKYNSAGVLQWTHNTPWDTANNWLGTVATDLAGNSYVTSGSSAVIRKVNTSGTSLYTVTGGGLDEYWAIAFNCDQTKLIVGGTHLFPNHGRIFDINPTTGAVTATTDPTNSRPGIFGIQDPDEIRAISSSYNAKYYFLSLDTIGAINQNLSACSSDPVMENDHGYDYAYKSENFKPNNGNGGIPAIKANANFVYTQDGNTVDKRSLTTGAIITSVAIPGGISTSSFGFNQMGNCGIDLDDCGNVYVGSGDRILKYDANLVLITSVLTSYKVSDIAVSTGGDVILCGTTGTSASTSRTGYVQSVNMSACAPITLACCDATICSVPTLCTTDAPINLSTTTGGGTFTGTGVTSGGVFDPAASGPGTFAITYTLPCGTETVSITVNTCSALSVCVEPSGALTVTGGTGPYAWDEWEAATSTPITNSSQCTSCGYTWFFGTCLNGIVPVTSCNSPAGWSNFGTGTTVTPPPGSDTIQVTGASGNFVSYNISTLPACTTVVCPSLTITPSLTVNVLCFGQTTGSFSASTTGGTGPYDYTLFDGSGATVATFTNIAGAQGFTGLGAGTYTLSTADVNDCPGFINVTITQPASAVSATITGSTNAACGVNDGTATVSGTGGTGAISYSWNTAPVQTTATATGLGAGSYIATVTDANGCSTTAAVTISNTSGPTASLVSADDITCNGLTNGTATINGTGGTGTLSYSWNSTPIQTTATATGLPAGTYTGTVTDGLGCSSLITVTIAEPSAIAITTSAADANCTAANGSATAAASGGTGTLTYSWNTVPVQTTPTATTLVAGTYTVTVTDSNSCTNTSTVTVNSIGGPVLTLSSTADPLCNGAATGSATVNATGGTGPLTYSWSPSGGTAATATGLVAGTYTLTVTDSTGCVSTINATIIQPNAIVITTSSTPADCSSSNGTATASATGGTGTVIYSWSPSGGTAATATGLAFGTYTVTVTDINGCTQTASEFVNTSTAASINAGPTVVIFAGDSTQLTATGGVSYVWTPSTGLSCDSCASPWASPTQTTTYTVTGTDASGCYGSDTITVIVDATCGKIFVPNAFSPNDDFENDLLCIYGGCIESVYFVIYDRWGEKVFETSDITACWDGKIKSKLANNAVFVYYLTATMTNGDVEKRSGNISLIK